MKLKYIERIAKTRQVKVKKGGKVTEENRIDILAKSLPKGAFTKNDLQL